MPTHHHLKVRPTEILDDFSNGVQWKPHPTVICHFSFVRYHYSHLLQYAKLCATWNFLIHIAEQ